MQDEFPEVQVFSSFTRLVKDDKAASSNPAIFLIVYGAYTNTLFIFKAKTNFFLKDHGDPHLCWQLNIEWFIKSSTHNPI